MTTKIECNQGLWQRDNESNLDYARRLCVEIDNIIGVKRCNNLH